MPEDWIEVKLGDVCSISSGESPTGLLHTHGSIPYFKVEQLNYSNKYIEKTPYKILFNADKIIKKNSIIFPKRGAAIMLNKIRILKQDSFMDTNLMSLTIDDTFFNEYLYYYLLYKNLSMVADTTSVPQINNKHIIPYKVIMPIDIKEQKAIAETLSNIDNLIDSLQKTIAKKEKIKHGVEENLFNNPEYKSMKLSEVTTMNAGGTPQTTNNKYYDGGKINWLSISDISSSNKKIKSTMVKITEEGLLNSSAKMFKKGTLFFAMYASIGKVIISEEDMCCSQAILGMKCEKIDRDFLYYYLSYKKNELMKMGQTGTQSNLSKKIMEEYIISIPNTIKEQKRIANTLNNFDSEIELLREKVLKYQKIKEGMMEDLLTGKVRLKYE